MFTIHHALRFYLLLICSVYTTYLAAQTISITDPNFEKQLVHLGIDSDNLVNGSMSSADALGILKLDLSSTQIQDLTGLEAFVDLDSLWCGDNPNLTSFPTNIIPSGLQFLNIHTCALSSLDLSQATSLHTLICYSNTALSNLQLPSSLTHLNCSNNNLSSLNLNSTPNLVFGLVSYNQLTSLDLSSLSNLEDFVFEYNAVHTLQLSNHPNLTYLKGDNNQLSSLDLSNCPQLTTLYLINNLLSTIDLSQNPLLRHVKLNDNQISTLDVSNNPALRLLFIDNNQLNQLDLSQHPQLKYITVQGNMIEQLDLNASANLELVDVSNCAMKFLLIQTIALLENLNAIHNSLGLRICVQDAILAKQKTLDGHFKKDPTAFYTQNCWAVARGGRIAIDANANCMVDTTELGIVGTIVKFSNAQQVYYSTVVDSLGYYQALLDTGWYVAEVIPPSPSWSVCNNQQQVYVDTNGYANANTINFSLQATASCPHLVADLGAPFLRKTTDATNFAKYTIHYHNFGTATAFNTRAILALDPLLSIHQTNLPVVQRQDQLYSFELGNLPVGASGSFQITVAIDSAAKFQQTHCSQVLLESDTSCVLVNWNGANLGLSGRCEVDSAAFIISNTGAPMQQVINYYVFEDNIMMRQGTFLLNQGDSIRVAQVALPGKSYRLVTRQEPGYPLALGDSILVATVEACMLDANGEFTVGTVTELYYNNRKPHVAVDCQENIMAYSANHKQAHPKGFDPSAHYIFPHYPLSYKIRFQNTGTDTAFHAIVVDTISPHLDLSTLKMGASSHPYTWTLNGRVLEIVFANIHLLDSHQVNTASYAFVNYYLEQHANNPDGTMIYNRAAIYLNDDDARFTNETFHTVHRNFIPIYSSTTDIHIAPTCYYMYPNPMRQQGIISVYTSGDSRFHVELFDAMGRLVQQSAPSYEQQILIERQGLPCGFYTYRIYQDGKPLGVGKVIME